MSGTHDSCVHPAVLVVDDEALIRWSMAEALGDAGYRVYETETGAATLDLVEWYRDPLVVVLDLHLPDVADLRLLRTIGERRPEIPVLLITASNTPAICGEALELGAAAVVAKPFDVQVVVDAVADAWADRGARHWPSAVQV